MIFSRFNTTIQDFINSGRSTPHFRQPQKMVEMAMKKSCVGFRQLIFAKVPLFS